MPSHAHETVPDSPSPTGSSERPPCAACSTDPEEAGGPAGRRQACAALVTAYGGDTYRLLTDLADLLEASVAYVDRPTVEAHVERPLSGTDWSAIASTFTAMAFDEHIGDAGTVRTDWIDDMLLRADPPGRGRGDNHPCRSLGQPPRP